MEIPKCFGSGLAHEEMERETRCSLLEGATVGEKHIYAQLRLERWEEGLLAFLHRWRRDYDFRRTLYQHRDLIEGENMAAGGTTGLYDILLSSSRGPYITVRHRCSGTIA